ncbi:MAG: S8/S53 family peptidase [Woeseia sp.]
MKSAPARGSAILRVTTGFVLCAALICESFAADALRLSALQRCGNLLDPNLREFCIVISGQQSGSLRLILDGVVIGNQKTKQSAVTFTVNRRDHSSGPFWVEQGQLRSNAAWLSMQSSATLAAGPDEVAENQDGITTYVDLVSILIEEAYDAEVEARRLASKYGAQLVGAIPPLRIYQIRLPVQDLIHRDALVLRLNGEESVDSVIIEESSSEDSSSEDSDPESVVHNGVLTRELSANRFMDAVDYYRRRIPGPPDALIRPEPIRIGLVERAVDFDAPDFNSLSVPVSRGLRLFARDANGAGGHGTTVAGVLAAEWDGGGSIGFLRGLDGHHAGIDVIVDRGSDAGITESIATSVRMVQDGVRVLNWSWGVHRVGTINVRGRSIDSVVRSGVAFEGYEELIEEFFKWLRHNHPNIIVINSAGNSDYYSENDDYRLPSSFLTPQLLVVGAHQGTVLDVPIDSPDFAEGRRSSNMGDRVDITAAGCVPGSNPDPAPGKMRCGTSYSTPLVTGVVAAMLTINPSLMPSDIRGLLRRASLPIGEDVDFESADTEDLTAPILPSERAEQIEHPDVGRSARLDMRESLTLAVESLSNIE